MHLTEKNDCKRRQKIGIPLLMKYNFMILVKLGKCRSSVHWLSKGIILLKMFEIISFPLTYLFTWLMPNPLNPWERDIFWDVNNKYYHLYMDKHSMNH